METGTSSITSENQPTQWAKCPVPTSNSNPNNTTTTPTPKANALGTEPQIPMASMSRFSAGSYYSYSHESFSLKYQTSDGDTFEMTSERETFEMMAWSQGNVTDKLPFDSNSDQDSFENGNPSDETNSTHSKENVWGAIRDVMNQVKEEMKQQQLHVLKSILGMDESSTDSLQGLWAKLAASRKASQDSDLSGNPLAWKSPDDMANGMVPNQAYSLKVTMEEMHLHMEWESEKAKESEAEDSEEAGGIPKYWNAENTSERIVNFAMQFANLQGEGAEEFISKMRDAIDMGFAKASQMMGALEGKAAKLNQDTHQKIYDKLDQKLADWQATPYNQVASQMPAKPMANAQSGSLLNLAA